MRKAFFYSILLLAAAGCGAEPYAESSETSDDAQAAVEAGHTVSSPDGTLRVTVTHDAASGALSYQVTRNGATVIEASPLGITTSVADFTRGLGFVARSDRDIDERYSLPGRKKSTYTNRANEMVLRFSKGDRELHLLVRAYDDGIAYRYHVPQSGSLTVSGESSAFNLPDSASGWAQSFVVSYEGHYRAHSHFDSGSFGMPVLARVGGDWLLLSESDVASSYHTSHLDGASGNTLRVVPPSASPVTAAGPFNSPWRLAMIGGLNTLVESTLVENLSAPSQLDDTSWIKPGRSAWSWRAGGNQSDYNTHVQYVDLAASMGWEYYVIDEGWQASWVPDLVSYARAKGVGILIWAHHRDVNTEAKMRALFSQWTSWGVQGVKLDFFENDSHVTMQLYETIARVAAEHRLLVNYHGCTKPNGLARKWPNVMTQEGVFGGEQGGLPASHNVSLIFTRNAVGAMDYTPVNYSTAGGHNTWAHQTALAIMYSSYIQHYADHWATYRDSVARDFLRAVPSVWDDTRLLEGYPDQYATIARRRGDAWYVGSIVGGGESRTPRIALSFLTPGVTYTAQIYRDGGSDNEIVHETRQVTSSSELDIPLRANGGVAIRLTTQGSPSALPNLAAGKPATADSSCNGFETASKAVNGSVANGHDDKWCSGGAKWLEVDLGATYTLSQLAVRHAAAGGESSAHNTRDFEIQTSIDNASWDTVVRVTGNTADATTHSIPPTSARYVRLHVTTGAQSGQANVARIYDLEVYGQGQFNTNAYYRIVNRNSGKALAVRNASTSDAESVVQWDYVDATTNDEWRLVEAGNGYYALLNRRSGKSLDVNGAVTTEGASLIQYTSRGSSNQQWQIIPTDNGYHRIVARHSGHVLDVYDRQVDNGAAVIQWPWGGGDNQQWQLVQVATIP
ncbi:glycoside hydrolase family 97 catalytic domain-containing protein [Sorangium sp. So ce1099]|uniref:glycoside hydrolase family 97 catalytic domain-containing protein n=1 Tax=Sorangium sp. So ce1099 TaxID=3133331 RepID=UPI003F5ED776